MNISRNRLEEILREEIDAVMAEQWPYSDASREEALEEAGTAPDGGNRVAAARKKCTDQGKWWDAKEVSKPGGIKRACKDKSKMPE